MFLSTLSPLSIGIGLVFVALMASAAIEDWRSMEVRQWKPILAFFAACAFALSLPTPAESLGRAVVGGCLGAVFMSLIRMVGPLFFKKESLGLGDITLGRALVALLFVLPVGRAFPLASVWVWFLVAGGFTLVFAGLIQLLPKRPELVSAPAVEEVNISRFRFLKYDVRVLFWYLFFFDLVIELMPEDKGSALAQRCLFPPETAEESQAEYDTTNHQPFGPALVASCLVMAFWGEPITSWYLKVAF